MTFMQGWINERAYRAQAQGAPKPEPLCEVAVMYLLFVVEKGVFCSFANGLIECTCAVLENVDVRQGRDYRKWQPALKVRRQSRPCFLNFSKHMDVKV